MREGRWLLLYFHATLPVGASFMRELTAGLEQCVGIAALISREANIASEQSEIAEPVYGEKGAVKNVVV